MISVVVEDAFEQIKKYSLLAWLMDPDGATLV